jgi:hypothetical protein
MAREERARRFDETRHLRLWEVRGEKLSLAEIDRRVERLSDEASLFGKHKIHFDAAARSRASAEVERFGEIRKEVVERIGHLQVELREKVDEAGKLLETLDGAYAREISMRQQPPTPKFTREELERFADNTETVKDAALLRELSDFEMRFNKDADPKKRFKPAEGWGRAPARMEMADMFHRQSTDRLFAFENRGEIQPLLIETSDGNLITYKLRDTRAQSFFELLARPIFETKDERELRHGVQKAFVQHAEGLKADFEQTAKYFAAAREIASAQAAERSLRVGRELPPPEPVFTPKQAMAIEKYAERQTDPNVREHFLGLARGSALSHFDSHPRTNSPEPDVAREVAPVGRGR